MADRVGSRTLGRGLVLLRALGTRREGATVAQLAVDTGLDRAVLYRLLATLCDHGFAHREGDHGRFTLGDALTELGDRVRAAPSAAGACGPGVAGGGAERARGPR